MPQNALVLVLVSFLLISCSTPKPQSHISTEPPPITMRSYDVPTHITERIYDKLMAPEPEGDVLAHKLRDYMNTKGYYPCASPHQLRKDINGEGYQLWCTYLNDEFQGRYFIKINPNGSWGDVVIEADNR
jgi:hypothetical protein